MNKKIVLLLLAILGAATIIATFSLFNEAPLVKNVNANEEEPTGEGRGGGWPTADPLGEGRGGGWPTAPDNP